MFKIFGIIGLSIMYWTAYAADDGAVHNFDCNYSKLRARVETYSGKVIEGIPSTLSRILKDLDFLSPSPAGKIQYNKNIDSEFSKLCINDKELASQHQNETLVNFINSCSEIYTNLPPDNRLCQQQSVYMLLFEVTDSLSNHYTRLEKIVGALRKTPDNLSVEKSELVEVTPERVDQTGTNPKATFAPDPDQQQAPPQMSGKVFEEEWLSHIDNERRIIEGMREERQPIALKIAVSELMTITLRKEWLLSQFNSDLPQNKDCFLLSAWQQTSQSLIK